MFRTGKIISQIDVSFNFFIQKYFFHDNPTWNINCSEYTFQVGTWSGYLEYLLKYQAKKRVCKNGIGIDKFGIQELNWN